MSKLTESDIQQIDHRLDFLLHVTRHLSKVSSETLEFFKSQKIDEQRIKELLDTAGSKFNEKIEDPRVVIDFSKNSLSNLVKKNEISWRLIYNNTKEIAEAGITVSSEDKKILGLGPSDKLGTSTVVPIDDSNKHLVKQEMRGQAEESDQVPVNVISGIEPPLTDNIVYTLHRDPKTKELKGFTAFSGFVAGPPLPDAATQSKEELAESQEWWAQHAFIK